MLGHDGPPQSFWRENLVTGVPLDRCPLRTLQLADDEQPALTREVALHADVYYPAYKDGHLLCKGGLADQPARYLEIIAEIRDVDNATRAKLLDIEAPDRDT